MTPHTRQGAWHRLRAHLMWAHGKDVDSWERQELTDLMAAHLEEHGDINDLSGPPSASTSAASESVESTLTDTKQLESEPGDTRERDVSFNSDFYEMAVKGWENYHAIAVAYDAPSHQRTDDSFRSCPAETCRWASMYLRGVSSAVSDAIAVLNGLSYGELRDAFDLLSNEEGQRLLRVLKISVHKATTEQEKR